MAQRTLEVTEMTEQLRKAIEELERLPESDQEALAAWLLDELRSERRWAELFAASPETLARLAEEAIHEFHAGKTQPFDPDAL